MAEQLSQFAFAAEVRRLIHDVYAECDSKEEECVPKLMTYMAEFGKDARYRKGVTPGGPYYQALALENTLTVFLSSRLCYGIVNLKPLVPGHVLIIPRRIVPRLQDLSEEETCEMWKIATLVVGPRLEKHYGAKALTYSVQDGVSAGQTVPHAHIHVLPRRGLSDFSPRPDDIFTAIEADDVSPEQGRNAARGPTSEAAIHGRRVSRTIVQRLFTLYAAVWIPFFF